MFFLLKKGRMNNTDLGYWTLPKPDVEVKEWSRIPRVAKTIAFGYEIDPEDDDFLVPISIQLDALDRAKIHLKQYSYREVANWLTKETGRYISHTGLRKRIEVDKRRKKAITIKRKFARRLEKAINEIKKLEEQSLDCFTTNSNARA